MKLLVIYDTSYGNTAKIAAAIAQGLGQGASAIEVEKLRPEDHNDAALLVVGSPTQGGRATSSLQQWIEALPNRAVRVATFDTRLGGDTAGWLQRLALDLIGYAAPRIARALGRKGYVLIDTPQGFIVGGGEGPLLSGELARATAWGATLKAQIQKIVPARLGMD